MSDDGVQVLSIRNYSESILPFLTNKNHNKEYERLLPSVQINLELTQPSLLKNTHEKVDNQ